jgi:hypothetical protein
MGGNNIDQWLKANFEGIHQTCVDAMHRAMHKGDTIEAFIQEESRGENSKRTLKNVWRALPDGIGNDKLAKNWQRAIEQVMASHADTIPTCNIQKRKRDPADSNPDSHRPRGHHVQQNPLALKPRRPQLLLLLLPRLMAAQLTADPPAVKEVSSMLVQNPHD